MKIAIIGTGNVGQALGAGWSQKGHTVIFGSRHPNEEKVRHILDMAGGNARAALPEAAAAEAEVVVLAVPGTAVLTTIPTLGNLSGKILVDATNPIAPGLQLAVGHTTSGAEQVAALAAGARVVKAFNTTGAENMANPIYQGEPITMFICGDEVAAKTAVTQLAQDLGFDVADVGGLDKARLLEPMALVWISLAMPQGMGRHIAFKLVRR
ncbi:MAG: NAD(P)-binding domain-containing protein [Chloroflexi bacterium]|nr:NAD(P)-binding domain-containing protein [Ardenticatenaceae bacterium]MBL1127553.1 F420-dependent NADP oxidoreductase [Chloroflexota bacterium]NOG33618.1 NAD(P)-binding domain-containing protein [Chloroflexota bacterium]GIK56575.1 MAG: NADPH-dependent F420 reductase [Chloroflexota bacterium]